MAREGRTFPGTGAGNRSPTPGRIWVKTSGAVLVAAPELFPEIARAVRPVATDQRRPRERRLTTFGAASAFSRSSKSAEYM